MLFALSRENGAQKHKTHRPVDLAVGFNCSSNFDEVLRHEPPGARTRLTTTQTTGLRVDVLVDIP
jgi:hypothetical protein